ncbi:MAG: DUF2809 domain-containing protein, partial [Bacteroidia bacterium]|nr:DUF2809 domain-containing protein [Bacteroidia bacterium]
TEITIAVFVFHPFVRGFIGDVLVIPLLYSLVRIITKLSVKRSVLLVLIVAFGIEFLQLFSLADQFGITNKVVQVVLGNTFDLLDLVAYCLGAAIIFVVERSFAKRH